MSKRLPDGSTTVDPELYQLAWQTEAELVEDLFPGYTLSSFDPNLVFTNFKTWDHFTLTVPAVRALRLGVHTITEAALGLK